MEHNYKEYLPEPGQPTDKLTRDPLPPDLEIAEAEYFADMAFDDRLFLLLEQQPSITHIDISHTTQGTLEGLASKLFTPNTTEVESIMLDSDTIHDVHLPAFSYQLRGYVQTHPRHLDIDATVTPSENPEGAVHIQSNRSSEDSFFVSEANGDIFAIDSVGLMYLLCQLGGANEASIDTLYSSLQDLHLDKPSILRQNIGEIWKQLGEMYGEATVTTELRHVVQQPARPDFPEHIKLRHEMIEKPDTTLTRLYLEHATEMPDLDVESSYCLKLEFEQITETNADANAERVTVTGINTPRLISLDFGRKLKGRITPLDIETIQIKELFVDWFDQIVSA